MELVVVLRRLRRLLVLLVLVPKVSWTKDMRFGTGPMLTIRGRCLETVGQANGTM
jgi:hypothetical protein